MKLKLAILKKPVYLIGGIVLFFLVLWLLNRSGSSSSSGTMVATTPQADPNVIAAGAAIQQAQIAAGVQVAGINASLAQNQTDADTALKLAAIQATTANSTLEAQTTIATDTLSLQGHTIDSNNQLAFNTAKLAYDNANYSTAVNAALTAHLSDNQTAAFNLQSELSHVTDVRLHGGQRLAVLQNIINTNGAASSIGSSSGFAAPPLPQTNWVG